MTTFPDLLFSKPIRNITSDNIKLNPVYLTFDDGPNIESTTKILNVLDQENIKASFFCVANRAKDNLSLFNEITTAGHSIGNHSLDHSFHNFFLGKSRMLNWVNASEQVFKKILNKPTIGFRSPAGIITPELIWALKELKIPLIHWKVRFFDSQFIWTEKKAIEAVSRLKKGDIILLHDIHRKNTDAFTDTLKTFIKATKEKDFLFLPITNI